MRQSFYSNQWMPHQNKDCYTVISVIRNNIYKGLENIIESQMIFDRYFPELNIAWKVAGINEKDEIARLVKKKYKIIFEDLSVQFLGPLREKELVREMINADLFVHPSHIENSPNSMCEAMLIGMPIIATSVGGVSSLLTNKEEGVLLQDGDPYSMAGAILELIKNKDRAVEYGQNARRIALERHDPNKIVEQIVNIYSSVIHN
jgi:glycosyltransferase involved in cell wall biosynthesis